MLEVALKLSDTASEGGSSGKESDESRLISADTSLEALIVREDESILGKAVEWDETSGVVVGVDLDDPHSESALRCKGILVLGIIRGICVREVVSSSRLMCI